nr:MAG TPA: hypothetical protein [Caudoviricetes sp.]
MFKKGQLVRTKRSQQYALVSQDEVEYSIVVDVWCLARKKHGYAFSDNLTLIGNNFKFKGVK